MVSNVYFCKKYYSFEAIVKVNTYVVVVAEVWSVIMYLINSNTQAGWLLFTWDLKCG